MVKKVFYIEKEKFLRSLIETLLRPKGAEVYTVLGLTDNFYLIDDLQPDILIFDWETCQEASPSDFEKLLDYGKTKTLIATTSASLIVSPDKRISIFLEKPLVVSELAEKILPSGK